MSSPLITTPLEPLDPVAYASGLVRGYCGRWFTLVTDELVTIDPMPNGSAQLPESPVVSISLVQAWLPYSGTWGWQTLTAPGQYDVDLHTGLIYDTARVHPPIDPSLQVGWPEPTWPYLRQSLQVTYTHGYAVIPDTVQDIVARIAQEVSANPYFKRSSTVGGVSDSWNVGQLTLSDMRALDRFCIVEVS